MSPAIILDHGNGRVEDDTSFSSAICLNVYLRLVENYAVHPLEECGGRSTDRSIDVHRAQLLAKQELLHQAAPDGIVATVLYCNNNNRLPVSQL